VSQLLTLTTSVGTRIRQRQRGGKYQRQPSSQRSCLLGLELKPELVWEDWDLGREFTKTLVLKNIYRKLQKLHVRPPTSTFFTTFIPQLIVLSPGTSFSMPICFRPLQRCEYEDSIEFQGKDGSFQVCLRAIIPCHALEVPDSVLLPICAVQNSSSTNFLLKNVSKLQTCFQWKCTAPFQLSPEQGLLKPGQESHITVVFRPQEALVYQQQANCSFGEAGDEEESSCSVLLQGLEQCGPVLHFGSVAVGQNLQKHFDIFNPSPVTAPFSLSRLPSGVHLLESEFGCDVTRGSVAPGGSLRALVTYTPAVVDSVSVEYLSLKCRGALNKTLLKLIGNCGGPNVSLSSSVLDFCCVEEGGAVVQTVELVNSAPVEAFYQWDLDCTGNSVFSIQPASGTVCPHSHTTLEAVYRPTQPIAHHRRVTCIIMHRHTHKHHQYSFYLPILILKPEHLVLYKQDSPETLTDVQQENEVHLDQQGVLCLVEEVKYQREPDKLTPMEEYYQSCLGYMDPLSRSSLSSPYVSVVPSELLFNHKISSSTSSQPVSITNHTRGKLSLVWTVAQDSPFTVSPSSCDLAPLKTTSFRVTYDPKQLNTPHGAQLECFAYYKVMLFDSLEGQLQCPPWCVTVRVIGHSFQPDKDDVIPCCSLQPLQVFPALSVLSYRTVLLQNGGDLPLTFCLDHGTNPAVAQSVSVVPSCGLIHPGKHQILTLRTTPTEDTCHIVLSGPLALQLDCERGTIVSRSTMLLRSTVGPHRRAQYLWTISYQMLNASAVCEVRAKGVFPTLQVIDVCSGGSVGRLSKVRLWKLFSLDSLNEHILSNPSPGELKTPTRHSSYPPVFTKAMLDFNFSATPMNSEPSIFVLMFHNPGSIPVDWAFLFPADQQIELDFWADTGEFSSTDLYQMKVQDNHLFSISPRSGTLLPGQQRAVHFTYSHDFAGTDRLPVMLKLSYGREISLNLQGLTVEKDRPYLHFTSKQHVFTSVTIGDCTPPKQVYELHNCGAVPVRYEVDTTVLSQLKEDNFNHPVLVCLNPEGEVLPGKMAMLEWIFSPLEAKMYHMDIPIHVQDGDSTLVRFEGCGFDSPTPGSTNPFNCSDTKASEPCVKRVPFPGQVVFLSENRVSLGNIPVCSQSSRILFLTNVSHTDSVHYKWDKQSYHTDDTHSVLSSPLQVFQEAALTRYRDALQRWEEEKKRRRHEFTIMNSNLTESQGVLIDKVLPQPLSFSRGILDDPAFIHSLVTLPSIPITYQPQETSSSHCPTSPPHLTPKPQVLLSGTAAQKEPVDREGTAGRLRNQQRTQNTAHTEHVPADTSEDVLLNTLQNLMMEAVRGELVLTSHPRTVILPPVFTR
uniref:Si:ch1073-349o24.2 n=1 Tax=Cyclopterus lumpus TaxID=8103 RepID=A0A8C3A4G6_CYCLU